jgi:hypothetical protein
MGFSLRMLRVLTVALRLAEPPPETTGKGASSFSDGHSRRRAQAAFKLLSGSDPGASVLVAHGSGATRMQRPGLRQSHPPSPSQACGHPARALRTQAGIYAIIRVPDACTRSCQCASLLCSQIALPPSLHDIDTACSGACACCASSESQIAAAPPPHCLPVRWRLRLLCSQIALPPHCFNLKPLEAAALSGAGASASSCCASSHIAFLHTAFQPECTRACQCASTWLAVLAE